MGRGMIKPPRKVNTEKSPEESREPQERRTVDRKGGPRPRELRDAMDHYSVEGLTLMWEIATDPQHEWHKKFGFDALKHLVSHCAPKRKEITGGEGGPVTLSLPNLFYGDSLPKEELEIKEAELIEDNRVEPAKDS